MHFARLVSCQRTEHFKCAVELDASLICNLNMKERNLRARRYLQAEHIVNNLKHSSVKPAIAPTKRIRKSRKRASAPASAASSVEPPAYLLYRNDIGELKRVQFVLGQQESDQQAAEEHTNHVDNDINISEMFLRKYRQLLQNNLITEDFYSNVAYDKEREVITLYNDDKDEGFEIYEKAGQVRQENAEVNDIMKEEDFEALVKDYHLNNLYC